MNLPHEKYYLWYYFLRNNLNNIENYSTERFILFRHNYVTPTYWAFYFPHVKIKTFYYSINPVKNKILHEQDCKYFYSSVWTVVDKENMFLDGYYFKTSMIMF